MGKIAAAESLKIQLPDPLSKRVKAIYAAAQVEQQRIGQKADEQVKFLLEGYLAGIPDADGRNFGLSEDGSELIEKPPLTQG